MNDIWVLVIIGITVILGALIFYENKKSSLYRERKEQQFWDRESKANSTRRKDITYLNYIEIPLSELPLSPCDDEEITEYQNIIQNMSTKKLLNLNGKTNTDLKLEYGVANLSILSEYDNNYTTTINTLTRWGKRLFDIGQDENAVTVLEYNLSIGSDISHNYYMLADYYRKTGKPEEIDRLISLAENTNTLMSQAIITKLKEIRGYCE